MFISDFIKDYIFENTSEFIVFVLIVAALFLLFRELRCWYWKINDRFELQNMEYEAMLEMIRLQKDEIRLLENALMEIRYGKNLNTVIMSEAAATKEEISSSKATIHYDANSDKESE